MAHHWLSHDGFGSLLVSFLSNLYVVSVWLFLINGRIFFLERKEEKGIKWKKISRNKKFFIVHSTKMSEKTFIERHDKFVKTSGVSCSWNAKRNTFWVILIRKKQCIIFLEHCYNMCFAFIMNINYVFFVFVSLDWVTSPQNRIVVIINNGERNQLEILWECYDQECLANILFLVSLTNPDQMWCLNTKSKGLNVFITSNQKRP